MADIRPPPPGRRAKVAQTPGRERVENCCQKWNTSTILQYYIGMECDWNQNIHLLQMESTANAYFLPEEAVRSSLLPTRRVEADMDTETLLIQLSRPRLTVAVCYRPTNDDAALERMSRCLSALPGTTPILIMGDFNLPEVQWTQRDGGALPELTRNSGRATRFLDQCGILGVSQCVTEPTRGRNILDLVLVRASSRCQLTPDLPASRRIMMRWSLSLPQRLRRSSVQLDPRPSVTAELTSKGCVRY